MRGPITREKEEKDKGEKGKKEEKKKGEKVKKNRKGKGGVGRWRE